MRPWPVCLHQLAQVVQTGQDQLLPDRAVDLLKLCESPDVRGRSGFLVWIFCVLLEESLKPI